MTDQMPDTSPITEIRNILNRLEEGHGGICNIFRIPDAVAEKILDLPFEDIEREMVGGLSRHEWQNCQNRRVEHGARALSKVLLDPATGNPISFSKDQGLCIGSAFVVTGGEYAIWDANCWRTLTDIVDVNDES